MNFNYSETPYRVRDDIPEAHRLIWQIIAEPGNWWNGQDRVSIIAETRHAIVDALGGLKEEVLLSHMAKRLARYKVPRTIEFSDEPLRDDAGKLRRKALRQERLDK
jgi:acyl-CoA synthetase (AMP-forming)/AMP-acid ligase II